MKLIFRYIILPLLGLFGTVNMVAQDSVPPVQDRLDGQIVSIEYTPDDTLLVSDLAGVSVSVPRNFEDADEYIRYQKYKRYAT